MKTIEYRTVDKSKWERGVWDAEPDKMQWLDEATGLPCLITRNHGGAWCGYVGVPPEHPAHGKDYNDVDVSVHGGLTFANRCQKHGREEFEKWRASMLKGKGEIDKYPRGDMAQAWEARGHLIDDFEAWQKRQQESGICHTTEPGEPDCVWWLGFDCSHSQDLSPAMEAILKTIMPERHTTGYASYKDINYVRAQCRELAQQLQSMV